MKNSDFKLIAIGGCGLSILDKLNEFDDFEFYSVAIDTDAARLAETESDSRLLLGQALTEGYGTGGDELVGARSLNGMHMELRERLAGSMANILVGGLGGGTATAILPELAKISRSLGVLTIVLATKPFNYEMQSKMVAAKRKLHSLVRSADSVFVLDNNAIAGEFSKLSAAEAHKRSDLALVETVRGLSEFLCPVKRVLLDFGTIKGQLTRGGLSALGTGVSAMRNNAIEGLKAAVAQFANNKSDITKAPRALIQFSIDDDVLMDGVKNAFGVAQRIFSKDAQLAMGVVFNSVRQGTTKVSVIASGLPLFNEVVEMEIPRKLFPGFKNPGHPLALSRTLPLERNREEPSSFYPKNSAGHSKGSPGIRAALWQGNLMDPENGSLKILNPNKLSEDELKIPAYLRRRRAK